MSEVKCLDSGVQMQSHEIKLGGSKLFTQPQFQEKLQIKVCPVAVFGIGLIVFEKLENSLDTDLCCCGFRRK